MNQYSETIGSFTRTGNYPLEANYVFESEEALKKFYQDPIAATTLHEGLLKIVKTETGQSLYWVVEGENGLEFVELINNLDIDNLEQQVKELIDKLNQEILDRQEADKEIWGTDDTSQIPEDLNNILKIATALKDFSSHLEEIYEELTQADQKLKEELKAVVGTEEDDIKAYLQTLNYSSLTDLSNTLNTFLNTIDSENESINTWAELQAFLDGYKDTDKLKDLLTTLIDDIMGDPLPTEQFRTLRGIEDFVRELQSKSQNTDANLQTELDQTQVGVGLSGDGSYNADRETYYLKEATSVMNALKILDSLIHDSLQEFVLEAANKDVVPLDIRETNNGYLIGASLLLSNNQGNQLIKKADGLYYNAHLLYEDGLVTLMINDSIVSQFNIGITSILDDGYYDSASEQIVLIFNKQDGTQQTTRIPVGSLIREWEPDNSWTSKVVEITRQEVVNGPDKVSADVRISEKAHNILQKDNNSLYVEGTSDAITYNDQTLTAVILDIQNKANTAASDLATEIADRKAEDSDIRNEITKQTSNLNTLIIQEQAARETADNEIKNLITTNSNKIDTVSKQVETVQSNLETEIQNRLDADQALRDDLERETDTLEQSIQTVRDSIASEKDRAEGVEKDIQSQLNNLTDNIVIEKQDIAEEGYAETYYLTVNGTQRGSKINVPQDKVLDTVTLKKVTEINTPYEGANIGDVYIEFVFKGGLPNKYLPVNQLLINYTNGNGIDIIGTTISAKVFVDDKYLTVDSDGIKSKGIDDAISKAIENKADINSPIFTGIPQIEISPDPTDASQRIPTTNWVIERIQEAYPVSPGSYWLKLENE